MKISFTVRCRNENETDQEVLMGLLERLKGLQKDPSRIASAVHCIRVFDVVHGGDSDMVFTLERDPMYDLNI